MPPEGAAPAAPAAGGANVSTPAAPAGPTGAPAPKGGAPAPALKPGAPTPGARPRANNGQFAPKDGTGEGEGAPGEEPLAQKEPYRFKRKLKVYGQEEDVDLDEDSIARELQQSRAMRKKLGDFDTTAKQARRILELAEQNPEEFLRQLKKDPDQWARERLAREAKLASMSEEERELEDLRQYKERTEQERKQSEETAEKQRKDQLRSTLRQKNEARFLEALKQSDLPKTYESLYYIAETAALGLDDGVEYSDAELAKETARRLDTLTDRYLGQMDGPALVKKLGPKRLQAILEAAVADFDAQQNFEAPTQAREEPVAQPQEYIDGAEVERRLREMRNGGKN